jgi:DNA mismatch endonuclease, patch repair protein
MADVVSPAVRSRMMAGIRGTNTKPELLLRSGLHRAGFRFRIHERRLPGKPDIVFPARRAVLFAHGCFWHGHDCALFKWPKSREEFWRKKIAGNRQVDLRSISALREQGWRIGIVWECALKGPGRLRPEEIVAECAGWLKSKHASLEIRGKVWEPK